MGIAVFFHGEESADMNLPDLLSIRPYFAEHKPGCGLMAMGLWTPQTQTVHEQFQEISPLFRKIMDTVNIRNSENIT